MVLILAEVKTTRRVNVEALPQLVFQQPHRTGGGVGKSLSNHANRIDVHFKFCRKPQVKHRCYEYVFVGGYELIGVLPDAADLALLVDTEGGEVCTIAHLSPTTQHIGIDPLDV